MTEKQTRTAVVIGAGPAGLTAAYKLLVERREDWRVIILEENSFPGGISRTVVHGKNRIDLGGHRFFSKSPEVNAIWRTLMPLQGAPAKDDIILHRDVVCSHGGPDPEIEDRVMLRRRRVSRIYYLRHFFDYPISAKPATFLALGIGRTFLAGMSYLKSLLFKRKEHSLEDFYINRFGKVLYSMFFEDYTEKLWGIHPSRISPEWGAQRVKGLSIAKAIGNLLIPKGGRRETSLIEEFIYPKKGPGQFWETMATAVTDMGGEIRYGRKVVKLYPPTKTAGESNHWRIQTEDGMTIVADALFSSMPICDLVASFPDVPQNVHEIASSLPYRDFITVGLLVDRLALKNRTSMSTVNNIVPDTWIYVQDRGVKIGRIQIFNNWSPYMVDDITKHVWIGCEYFCSEGDDMWQMTDPELTNLAAKELRTIGVLDAVEPIRDSICIRVKKAYPAYFGTYARFNEVREWLDSQPGLFCIGRNGQHRYNNMDHSMLCAVEAVHALLAGTDVSAVWNVNTEDEYHETKDER